MAKNYESFLTDDNNRVIPTGTSFSTADATATPNKSPLSVPAQPTVTTITFPSKSAELVLMPDGALRVSELSNMTQYVKMSANNVQVFPSSRQETIYVAGDSGTVTLSFYFINV